VDRLAFFLPLNVFLLLDSGSVDVFCLQTWDFEPLRATDAIR